MSLEMLLKEKDILKSILAMPKDELWVHFLFKVEGQRRSRIAERLNVTVYRVNKLLGNIIEYLMNDPILKKTTFLELDWVTMKYFKSIKSHLEGKSQPAKKTICEQCEEELSSENCCGPAQEMDMCNYCYKEQC